MKPKLIRNIAITNVTTPKQYEKVVLLCEGLYEPTTQEELDISMQVNTLLFDNGEMGALGTFMYFWNDNIERSKSLDYMTYEEFIEKYSVTADME